MVTSWFPFFVLRSFFQRKTQAILHKDRFISVPSTWPGPHELKKAFQFGGPAGRPFWGSVDLLYMCMCPLSGQYVCIEVKLKILCPHLGQHVCIEVNRKTRKELCVIHVAVMPSHAPRERHTCICISIGSCFFHGWAHACRYPSDCQPACIYTYTHVVIGLRHKLEGIYFYIDTSSMAPALPPPPPSVLPGPFCDAGGQPVPHKLCPRRSGSVVWRRALPMIV